MAIERWRPFSELMSIKEAVDRLFEDSLIHPFRAWGVLNESVTPPLDVYQTPKEVVVKAAVPGLKPEDITVEVIDETLTIKGEVKAEEQVRKEDYLYQERHYGSFSRSVNLPAGLKPEQAEATLEDGILTITIPKSDEVKPRTIKVKARTGK